MKIPVAIALYIVNVFLVFLFASMYIDAKERLVNLRIESFYVDTEFVHLGIPNELIYLERPPKKPESIQLGCLAVNIFHEARGEGLEGMRKVGFVTMNRVEAKSWPDTICSVVYQPKQFSWTMDDPMINFADVQEVKSYEKALKVSRNIIKGRIDDTTNGATHYYAHNKIDPPVWANSFNLVEVVGNHTFLK